MWKSGSGFLHARNGDDELQIGDTVEIFGLQGLPGDHQPLTRGVQIIQDDFLGLNPPKECEYPSDMILVVIFGWYFRKILLAYFEQSQQDQRSPRKICENLKLSVFWSFATKSFRAAGHWSVETLWHEATQISSVKKTTAVAYNFTWEVTVCHSFQSFILPSCPPWNV